VGLDDLFAKGAADGSGDALAAGSGEEGIDEAFTAIGQRAEIERGIGVNRAQARGDVERGLMGGEGTFELIGRDEEAHFRLPFGRSIGGTGGAVYA
jgi:hypothetical protein